MCIDIFVKHGVNMMIYGSIYWDIVRSVVSESGRGNNYGVDSDIGDEVGQGWLKSSIRSFRWS